MKSVKLSAVVLYLNEEDSIERCLKSIRKVAHEIIVVDSFSQDATEAI